MNAATEAQTSKGGCAIFSDVQSIRKSDRKILLLYTIVKSCIPSDLKLTHPCQIYQRETYINDNILKIISLESTKEFKVGWWQFD